MFKVHFSGERPEVDFQVALVRALEESARRRASYAEWCEKSRLNGGAGMSGIRLAQEAARLLREAKGEALLLADPTPSSRGFGGEVTVSAAFLVAFGRNLGANPRECPAEEAIRREVRRMAEITLLSKGAKGRQTSHAEDIADWKARALLSTLTSPGAEWDADPADVAER